MIIYSRSEELVSRCVKCDLAEPESLESLGGSAPGLVDGILSVVDQTHSVIESGKRISISKFHQINGHTGQHVLKLPAKFMKIELTGKLAPCEICVQAKIMNQMYQRIKY